MLEYVELSRAMKRRSQCCRLGFLLDQSSIGAMQDRYYAKIILTVAMNDQSEASEKEAVQKLSSN